MSEEKELLAYCGLYCGDCAGYSGEIADAASELQKAFTKYKFERTANSMFSKELEDFDKFCEMLQFMTQLKCSAICRERKDGETKCEIRKCCIDKGYYACHECDDFETCEKLINDLQNDACVKNLRAIKEMGIENWIKKGKRYWFGSDVDTFEDKGSDSTNPDKSNHNA